MASYSCCAISDRKPFIEMVLEMSNESQAGLRAFEEVGCLLVAVTLHPPAKRSEITRSAKLEEPPRIRTSFDL